MKQIYLIKLKPLLLSILIPVGLGFLVGFLTIDSMNVYSSLVKPAAAPPEVLFPIVWTILYILMGISSYLVYTSDSPYKNDAMRAYVIQLVVNLIWPIIFFIAENYFLSLIWIILLLVLIIIMIKAFLKVDKFAAYLQLPYLLWVTFATYLNYSIFILNK